MMFCGNPGGRFNILQTSPVSICEVSVQLDPAPSYEFGGAGGVCVSDYRSGSPLPPPPPPSTGGEKKEKLMFSLQLYLNTGKLVVLFVLKRKPDSYCISQIFIHSVLSDLCHAPLKCST